MNYTDEMIAKAKTAASAAELQAMAKEYNIELSDTEAAEYFDFLHGIHKVNKDGLQELSDVELEMVAGGKGAKDPDPKFYIGQHLWLGYFTTQNYDEIVVTQPEFYVKGDGWRYLVTDSYGYMQNEYLETREYVHTTDPGPGWHD